MAKLQECFLSQIGEQIGGGSFDFLVDGATGLKERARGWRHKCVVWGTLNGLSIPAEALRSLPKGILAAGGVEEWNGSYHECHYWYEPRLAVAARSFGLARKYWRILASQAVPNRPKDSSVVRFQLRALVRPGD